MPLTLFDCEFASPLVLDHADAVSLDLVDCDLPALEAYTPRELRLSLRAGPGGSSQRSEQRRSLVGIAARPELLERLMCHLELGDGRRRSDGGDDAGQFDADRRHLDRHPR